MTLANEQSESPAGSRYMPAVATVPPPVLPLSAAHSPHARGGPKNGSSEEMRESSKANLDNVNLKMLAGHDGNGEVPHCSSTGTGSSTDTEEPRPMALETLVFACSEELKGRASLTAPAKLEPPESPSLPPTDDSKPSPDETGRELTEKNLASLPLMMMVGVPQYPVFIPGSVAGSMAPHVYGAQVAQPQIAFSSRQYMHAHNLSYPYVSAPFVLSPREQPTLVPQSPMYPPSICTPHPFATTYSTVPQVVSSPESLPSVEKSVLRSCLSYPVPLVDTTTPGCIPVLIDGPRSPAYAVSPSASGAVQSEEKAASSVYKKLGPSSLVPGGTRSAKDAVPTSAELGSCSTNQLLTDEASEEYLEKLAASCRQFASLFAGSLPHESAVHVARDLALHGFWHERKANDEANVPSTIPRAKPAGGDTGNERLEAQYRPFMCVFCGQDFLREDTVRRHQAACTMLRAELNRQFGSASAYQIMSDVFAWRRMDESALAQLGMCPFPPTATSTAGHSPPAMAPATVCTAPSAENTGIPCAIKSTVESGLLPPSVTRSTVEAPVVKDVEEAEESCAEAGDKSTNSYPSPAQPPVTLKNQLAPRLLGRRVPLKVMPAPVDLVGSVSSSAFHRKGNRAETKQASRTEARPPPSDPLSRRVTRLHRAREGKKLGVFIYVDPSKSATASQRNFGSNPQRNLNTEVRVSLPEPVSDLEHDSSQPAIWPAA